MAKGGKNRADYCTIKEAMKILNMSQHKVRFRVKKNEFRTQYFSGLNENKQKIPRYIGLLKEDVYSMAEKNKVNVDVLRDLMKDHLTIAEFVKASKISNFAINNLRSRGQLKMLNVRSPNFYKLIPISCISSLKTLSPTEQRRGLERARDIINDPNRGPLPSPYEVTKNSCCTPNQSDQLVIKRVHDYTCSSGFCSLKFASRYLEKSINQVLALIKQGKISYSLKEEEGVGLQPIIIISSMVKYRNHTSE